MYVKTTLLLNYFGQGAWILNHPERMNEWVNPFFAIMPHWFLIIGILVSTAAAIIASQALISGSYTLISEAISLNFWPKIKINYPDEYQRADVYFQHQLDALFRLRVCCFVFPAILQHGSGIRSVDHHYHADDHHPAYHLPVL